MTAADLLRDLNQLDEHPRVEAKTGSELGKSALQTVCAFANEPRLGGGHLLFGVSATDHENGRQYHAAGVPEPDKLQADLASRCASMFNHPVRPEMWVEVVDGNTLVGAYIPESPSAHKPIYFQAQGLPRGHSAGSAPPTSGAPTTTCSCSSRTSSNRRSTVRPCWTPG